MGSKGFVPKVKQLEELKVAFDDAGDPDGHLPQTINSKTKTYIGPTNNREWDGVSKFNRKMIEAKRKGGKKGATFGFVTHEDSSEEESKDQPNVKTSHWQHGDLKSIY